MTDFLHAKKFYLVFKFTRFKMQAPTVLTIFDNGNLFEKITDQIAPCRNNNWEDADSNRRLKTKKGVDDIANKELKIHELIIIQD